MTSLAEAEGSESASAESASLAAETEILNILFPVSGLRKDSDI